MNAGPDATAIRGRAPRRRSDLGGGVPGRDVQRRGGAGQAVDRVQVDAGVRPARRARRRSPAPRRGVRRPGPGRGGARAPRQPSSRRSAPSTGTPELVQGLASGSLRCASEPTRFRITPAIRTAGSNERKPCTSAATERPCAAASTTSSTGASSSLATCAVEANSPVAGRAVEQAHDALDDGDVGLRRRRARTAARCARCRPATGRGCGRGARWPARGSRGRCSPGRPCAGTPPARGGAARPCRPVATVVLPLPEAGGRDHDAGHHGLTTRCPSGPSGRRPSGA